MKKSIIHPSYGEIVYEEGIWSGKKSISINGTPLQKVKKNEYLLGEGENAVQVTLGGSVLTGVALSIRGEDIWIVPKPTGLDWILSAVPFVLILAWGNSVKLCSIIPVVGGAIGGAIGGVAMVVTMFMIREKKFAVKLLTALLATALTFGGGAALGYAIVYTMLM